MYKLMGLKCLHKYLYRESGRGRLDTQRERQYEDRERERLGHKSRNDDSHKLGETEVSPRCSRGEYSPAKTSV